MAKPAELNILEALTRGSGTIDVSKLDADQLNKVNGALMQIISSGRTGNKAIIESTLLTGEGLSQPGKEVLAKALDVMINNLLVHSNELKKKNQNTLSVPEAQESRRMNK